MEIVTKKKKSDSVTEYDVFLSEELKRVFPLERIRQAELIVGISEILDIDDIGNIVQNVIKANACAWSLAYSSSLHKRSLVDFYARLDYVSATNSPLVILVKDKMKRVCGVFLSDFDVQGGDLFHCRPLFCRFKGMTEAPPVVTKSTAFMSVVDNAGRCGLWVDSRLEECRTEEFSTDCSSDCENVKRVLEERQFQIKTFECWTISETN